jgi:hypothetical protein
VSITTYATLQTAVARWLKRDDLTTQIPDYIAFGENRLWYGDKGQFQTTPLRTRLQIINHEGTIASQRIDLSANYLETQSLSVSSGGKRWALRYLPPHQFVEHEAKDGDPQYYTMLDEENLKTAPSNSLAFVHNYYWSFPSLTTTNISNELLIKHPELYLFAACVEGALDIMSDSMAARFAAKLQAKINALQQSQANQMAGGSLAVTIGR